MDPYKIHSQKIKAVAKQLVALQKRGGQGFIRFDHGGTHSTRIKDGLGKALPIGILDQILEADVKRRVAVVEPAVSMEKLVDECLKYRLVPKVVPEFPAITAGGAVNGAALESSSFKYGQFNDICTEYEFLLGNGSLVKAGSKVNPDLFYGIAGSMGSLALLTLVTVSLIPAKPYVELTIRPVKPADVVRELKLASQGKDYDFVEAVLFSRKSAVLLLGRLSDDALSKVKTFSGAKDEWFSNSIEHNQSVEQQITIPVKDYLFRYDRGAFWMGRHAFDLFHVPFNRLTRYLLDPFFSTKVMYQGLQRTGMSRKFFIQDFYLPDSKVQKFISLCDQKLKIYPLWLCPVAPAGNRQFLSPHSLPADFLIDVGVWGKNPVQDTAATNRFFENLVQGLGGRKMLYAENFYTPEQFWQIYDRARYLKLRKKYHAEIFPQIWDKVTVRKNYPANKWKVLPVMWKAVFERGD